MGRLLVEALGGFGVAHVYVSPGSRSTPLVQALGEGAGPRYTVCLDERSAAFRALGHVKASRRPVAFVCTSGTAGAHAYPAFIEAHESALPLLVLTADRPPELRHCHAGQTIDQVKLFGAFARYYAEFPLPEPDARLAVQVREICRVAIERSLGSPPGPVHLNCPFREPFFPEAEEVDEIGWAGGPTPAPVEPMRSSVEVRDVLPERTLILAGPRPWVDRDSEIGALCRFALKNRLPILADGANPLRQVADPELPVIQHYDRMARDDGIWKDLVPECVLLWGEPPTSKVLRRRLAEAELRGYQAGEGNPVMNPFQGAIRYTGNSIATLLEGLSAPGKAAYLTAWAGRDRYFELVLREGMSTPHNLFEGDLHRLLGTHLSPGTPLVLASSLAIRDAEWFLPRGGGLLPFSQRGANGIDGTLSMARGIAAGLGRPTVLVSGDLAFLHDSNGMLGAASDEPGVLAVVADNGGGGIFEFLPVASRSRSFRELFLTPQEVDLRCLVEAHGGRYLEANYREEVESALASWEGNGLTVIHVQIDREQSLLLHRRLVDQGGRAGPATT